MVPAGDPRAGEGNEEVAPHLVREQLARIVGSRRFVDAPTLARLLQHLVGRTLDGDAGQLKEYSVGLDVFNRGPSFDPHTDTIVRVHARRLRKRLDEYYAGEGRADPILIGLPKGHVPGVDVGAIYNGLGEREMALHWIERARVLRCFDATFVLDDPRFADLRSELGPVV